MTIAHTGVRDWSVRHADTGALQHFPSLDGPVVRDLLLHGDIRADSMFFDGTRLKVVDFQMAAHGVAGYSFTDRAVAAINDTDALEVFS